MKNCVFTFLLVAGMALISFVGTASAVVSSPVDYNGSFVDMGTLSSGQYGTIYADKAVGGVAVSQISALLPSHNMLTLSYNFGTLKAGVLAVGGDYSYNVGGDLYEGFTAAVSDSPLVFAGSAVNGVIVDTPLAYAAANVDVKAAKATAVITNHSGGFLDITSALFALVGDKKYTISYSVTEAPIPAALPMFAMGLCAVAGLRRRKKETV